jgi:hypothetical protein
MALRQVATDDFIVRYEQDGGVSTSLEPCMCPGHESRRQQKALVFGQLFIAGERYGCSGLLKLLQPRAAQECCYGAAGESLQALTQEKCAVQ